MRVAKCHKFRTRNNKYYKLIDFERNSFVLLLLFFAHCLCEFHFIFDPIYFWVLTVVSHGVFFRWFYNSRNKFKNKWFYNYILFIIIIIIFQRKRRHIISRGKEWQGGARDRDRGGLCNRVVDVAIFLWHSRYRKVIAIKLIYDFTEMPQIERYAQVRRAKSQTIFTRETHRNHGLVLSASHDRYPHLFTSTSNK